EGAGGVRAGAGGRGVARWLRVLLALAGSSPFWLGADTGSAGYRPLIWQRWPTAGAFGRFGSAAEYDQTVADLVGCGVITDPSMIYFDVRPSAHLPTLELRICDSCPRVEDVVLLAGAVPRAGDPGDCGGKGGQPPRARPPPAAPRRAPARRPIWPARRACPSPGPPPAGRPQAG